MFDIKNRLVIWNVCVCFWLLCGASGETDYDGRNEVTECKSSQLEVCNTKAFEGMDKGVLTRMPISEKEISSSCSGFYSGMKCINDYAKQCLDEKAREVIETVTSGARKMYHHLCNDKAFKSEYLQHKTCLKATQEDWESCVNRFRQLMHEIQNDEMKKNSTHETRLIEKCCALHGFKGCVYVPSRLKCFRDSALFLLKLAELSIDTTEASLNYCQRVVDSRICVGCANSISITVMTLSYLFLRHYC